LLIWLAQRGGLIINEAVRNGPDENANALCKLLVALGDHSSEYFALNIASTRPAAPAYNPVMEISSSALPTRAQLVQNFMRLMLAFTALPGFYGIDEEESEMTLGFWYSFQDALWSAELSEEDQAYQSSGNGMMDVSKEVYAELVGILRNKVRWPAGKLSWQKGPYCCCLLKTTGSHSDTFCRSN
jgi:hypothetical protein